MTFRQFTIWGNLERLVGPKQSPKDEVEKCLQLPSGTEIITESCLHQKRSFSQMKLDLRQDSENFFQPVTSTSDVGYISNQV